MVAPKPRGVVAALLVLLAAGLVASPAPATADDRGILEHDVPIDMSVSSHLLYPAMDHYKDEVTITVFESPPTEERMKSVVLDVEERAAFAALVDDLVEGVALVAACETSELCAMSHRGKLRASLGRYHGASPDAPLGPAMETFLPRRIRKTLLGTKIGVAW